MKVNQIMGNSGDSSSRVLLLSCALVSFLEGCVLTLQAENTENQQGRL